jgi:hypothetical protein
VRIVPEAGVVLVHRVRAEHIARALGAVGSIALLVPPTTTARQPLRLPAPTAVLPPERRRPWRLTPRS